MKSIKRLNEERSNLLRESQVLLDQAVRENRQVKPAEDLRLLEIRNKVFDIDADIARTQLELQAAGRSHLAQGNMPDLRGYSLCRAITQAGQGRLDGLEAEVSREIELREGKAPSGFWVPHTLLTERRSMSVTGGTTGQYGGAFVATEVVGFIDALRPFLRVLQAGATAMSGLTSNVSLPRQSAASTASFKGETAELDEKSPVIDQLELSPRRVGAWTQLSKQLLIQSSPDIERIVRDDLMSACAIALDFAAIAGAGGTAPTGILATNAIGAVEGGTNGALPEWADLVALIGKVADANADVGSLAFLSNSKVASYLRSTPKVEDTDSKMLLESNDLLGYPFLVSNQVPDNLTKGSATSACSAIIYGNWQDVILASWGQGVDLLVDPFTQATAGMTRVIANSYCDVGIRRAASFAAMKDVLVASA